MEYLKIFRLAAKESESLVDSVKEKLIRKECEIAFEMVNILVLEGLEPEKVSDTIILLVDTKSSDCNGSSNKRNFIENNNVDFA